MFFSLFFFGGGGGGGGGGAFFSKRNFVILKFLLGTTKISLFHQVNFFLLCLPFFFKFRSSEYYLSVLTKRKKKKKKRERKNLLLQSHYSVSYLCIVRTILADVRQVVKPAAVVVMPASTALSPIHHSAVLNTGDTTAGLAPGPVAVAVPDLFACTHTLIQSNMVKPKI